MCGLWIRSDVRSSFIRSGNIASAFFLHTLIGEKDGYFGSWGVNCGELENVQEEDAVVVEQMLNCFASKSKIGVCQLRNHMDRICAIYVGDNL